MGKTKLPPVDMKHVSKYTKEIIEKLKKKDWGYNETFNIWEHPARVSGFLYHEDSFKRITEQSKDKVFFKLPGFSLKKWKMLESIYYATENNTKNTFYGIDPERLIEIGRALKRNLKNTRPILRDIVLGFHAEQEDVVIAFVPYRDDYARFVIAPRILNAAYYGGETRIYGTTYFEPRHLFYDIKTGIIGPLYKGKIITMDDYKQAWVVHLLSNS